MNNKQKFESELTKKLNDAELYPVPRAIRISSDHCFYYINELQARYEAVVAELKKAGKPIKGDI